jgi:hypothetical protein
MGSAPLVFRDDRVVGDSEHSLEPNRVWKALPLLALTPGDSLWSLERFWKQVDIVETVGGHTGEPRYEYPMLDRPTSKG